MWKWAEATLTAAGGSAIAYGTGLVVGGAIDAAWLPAAAALAGAGNGGFAGARRIYAWSTIRGWTAFVLDSSWALIGAVQGLISNTASTVSRRGDFSPELSERRNRHVFGAGFALRPAFATTHGNVISNARLGRPEPIADRVRLIENHEDLHVWQQRWFGPLFPLTYVIFGILGVAIGAVFGLLSRERRRRGIRIGKLVETAAYYDNPFEVWAYAADGRWETCAAEPVLKWGRFRWGPLPTTDDRAVRFAGNVHGWETTMPRGPKFELYQDKAGKYRFRLKAANNEIIATSEAYESKASAKNGIKSVQRNAPKAEVIEV